MFKKKSLLSVIIKNYVDITFIIISGYISSRSSKKNCIRRPFYGDNRSSRAWWKIKKKTFIY